jgi:malonyl-CoA decarboxylase
MRLTERPENGTVAVVGSWLEQVGLIADRGREILNFTGLTRKRQTPRELSKRLLAQRGEASGLAMAHELVDALARMTDAEVAAFLEMLAADFSPDAGAINQAIERWRRDADLDSLLALAAAVEAPRQELFRRLNMAPAGTATLVEMRARLLGLLRERPHLEAVDADLKHLLASWFNRGFLRLERIDWRSPAAVLEKLIAYEAVHEITGWDDLRGRLAADRRCFAFFHPALPGEPLIFVEVALTDGLADAIGPLLDPRRSIANPTLADSAIFYSISNCQVGLRGISFGNFLIKHVVGELSAEFPRIKTFATLSPLPRLAELLRRRDLPHGFSDARIDAVIGDHADELCRRAGIANPVQALLHLLDTPAPQAEPVRRILARLALAYLVEVRDADGVLDPVAEFHLSNGARLERINPAANLSRDGLGQSHGVMVNYLYDPDRLEFNHERYIDTGEVTMSRKLAAEHAALRAAWRSASQGIPDARPPRSR